MAQQLSMLSLLSLFSIVSGVALSCWWLKKLSTNLSQTMDQILSYLDTSATKLCYLERRADAAESHPQDILRCRAEGQFAILKPTGALDSLVFMFFGQIWPKPPANL